MTAQSKKGQIRVDYDGRLPRGLNDFLSQTKGIRVISSRPLAVETSRPERMVSQLMGYADEEMRARRITVRPGPGSSLPNPINPPMGVFRF